MNKTRIVELWKYIYGRILRLISMAFQLISGLFQQATAHGSRTTVLRPLGWLACICLLGIFGCIDLKAPAWMAILFVGFTTAVIVLYLFAYIYCLCYDRDALRSETYSIQKLAIEKSYRGDSLTGIIELNDTGRASIAEKGE